MERIEYSHAYYQDFHDYTRDVLGDDRVNTIRPVDNYGADIGGESVQFGPIDITWAGWVGDQDPTFSGLEAALRNMYWSDHDGYTIFGSDIGGYRSGDGELGRTKELFVRWTQLGAFSGIMENGGSKEHRPWMFDDETTDIYRVYAKLHEALIPYLMEQGAQAFSERRGLMHFQSKSNKTFLLGDDIFVVPVMTEGGAVSVDLPSGTWVNPFDDSVYESGAEPFELTVNMAQYPVFYREGSAVGSILVEGLRDLR